MEKKQTAVEWLMDQILDYNDITFESMEEDGCFELAKHMEKMQRNDSREALHAAFKAGWMKANATNYNESYFNHYYDNL